jgi:hypothetical protein
MLKPFLETMKLYCGVSTFSTKKFVINGTRLPKPSLEIRTASDIFWDYIGMFRDYGQKKFWGE